MPDLEKDKQFNRFGNMGTLKKLAELIKNKHIIPFVGAGMSADIYGSWGEALKRMMEGHLFEDETATVEDLIGIGLFEQAAEKINDLLGVTVFQDRIDEVFGESKIIDEYLEKMSVRYLPRLFSNSLVVTTNFDKVLERIFLKEQYSFVEKLTLNHLTAWQAEHSRHGSQHYLIKIHGCVSAPDEVVMTETLYKSLYKPDSEALERLRSILMGNKLLFIGCSLKKDRTVDILGEKGLDGHYAILEMDDKDDSEAFKTRRLAMSNDLKMHCIWYPKGKHHYVEDILEYICAVISGQPNLPITPDAIRSKPNIASSPTPQPIEILRPIAKPLIKGEPYTMGSWEGKPMEWLILDVQPDKALLIAKYCLLQAPYHEEYKSVTWEECSLRIVLLPHLMEQIFDDEERERVLLWPNKNPDNKLHNTRGGDDTEDKLFLLSIDEVKQYFPYNDARTSRLSGESVWWWLRSPGYYSHYAAFVYCDGSVYVYGLIVSSSGGAVRPAFWLNRKS